MRISAYWQPGRKNHLAARKRSIKESIRIMVQASVPVWSVVWEARLRLLSTPEDQTDVSQSITYVTYARIAFQLHVYQWTRHGPLEPAVTCSTPL